MGRRRSSASAVAVAVSAGQPACGPEGTSAPAAGEALASAGDWPGTDWAGAGWAGAGWEGAGLGLATRRWGSEDGWVRTGGADAGDGLASARGCVKADGGLASD